MNKDQLLSKLKNLKEGLESIEQADSSGDAEQALFTLLKDENEFPSKLVAKAIELLNHTS